jgi:hypothetical protein
MYDLIVGGFVPGTNIQLSFRAWTVITALFATVFLALLMLRQKLLVRELVIHRQTIHARDLHVRFPS